MNYRPPKKTNKLAAAKESSVQHATNAANTLRDVGDSTNVNGLQTIAGVSLLILNAVQASSCATVSVTYISDALCLVGSQIEQRTMHGPG